MMRRTPWIAALLASMAIAACSLEPDTPPSSGGSPEPSDDQTPQPKTDIPRTGPELLNALIAKVATRDPETLGDFGSAIIVERRPHEIRLVTAEHVVITRKRLGGPPRRAVEEITVEFWFDRGTKHVARVEWWAEARNLDLAVLSVPVTASLEVGLQKQQLDLKSLLRRVRSPESLRLHDGLHTIGNPYGIPWYSAPFELDRLLTVGDDDIDFRSGFVDKGHSGGGLFSQDWYLVGMITGKNRHGGVALRIDRIAEQIEATGKPAALKVPVLPPEPEQPIQDCRRCPELTKVPSGTFVMGADENENYPARNETPRRPVTIGAPFLIGRYEVTHREFRYFVEDTGYEPERGCEIWTKNKRAWQSDDDKSWREPGYPVNDDLSPVVCVNWNDAKAYVDWLSRITGHSYRLPSSAEWEYAARAWTNTRYWWGDHLPENRASCDGCGSRWDLGRAAPVGSFPANPFGLYEVHGNVWEWTEDCWHESYAGAPTDGRAWLEDAGGNCKKRMQRGGSSITRPETLRSANRLKDSPKNRKSNVGFRVIRDP